MLYDFYYIEWETVSNLELPDWKHGWVDRRYVIGTVRSVACKFGPNVFI